MREELYPNLMNKKRKIKSMRWKKIYFSNENCITTKRNHQNIVKQKKKKKEKFKKMEKKQKEENFPILKYDNDRIFTFRMKKMFYLENLMRNQFNLHLKSYLRMHFDT